MIEFEPRRSQKYNRHDKKNSEPKAPIIAAVITGIFAILVALISGYYSLEAAQIKQDSSATSAFHLQTLETQSSTPLSTQTILSTETLRPTDTSTPLPATIAPTSASTPTLLEIPTAIIPHDAPTASLSILCIDTWTDNSSWIRTFIRKIIYNSDAAIIDVFNLYINHEKVQTVPENQLTTISVTPGTVLVQVTGSNRNSPEFQLISSEVLVLNMDAGDTADLECGKNFLSSAYLKVTRFTNSTK